ncbi:glycosyltransferase family 2 protein [Cadophora sp. DSE1049]|nr:glycosyltransferase family 2 protein [Cadophora sp. DSE1049]
MLITYPISFTALSLYRYVRLIVNCGSSWTFRSIPPPENPSYTSDDVTVLIPTICCEDQHDDFRLCLRSCLATKPHEILVSTIESDLLRITELAHSIDPRIQVMAASFANKRQQIYEAIPRITTSITILADDDIELPSKSLPHILAPFEDSKIGAVGTCQRVRRRPGLGILDTMWQYLGECYIERRNFEISATSHIDGRISCLSGRVAAIRTEILQSKELKAGYVTETWLGKRLNADDDNFVTRFLVAKGWGIRIQMSKEAEVLTTLEFGWGFLKQCLRWARSNWRSNIKSIIFEWRVWMQTPWSLYALLLATLSHSLITDPLIGFLLHCSTITWDPSHRLLIFCIFALWLLFTKVVKLLPHFALYPRDICLLPVTILFGYCHGLIKLYALFTLHVITWGSRNEHGKED